VNHQRRDAYDFVTFLGKQYEELLLPPEVLEPEREPFKGALDVVGTA
jgi:hypothetical protein